MLTACSVPTQNSTLPGPADNRQQTIISEGQAAVGPGGRLLARRQALQEAIRQAALTREVNIVGKTELADHAISSDRVILRTAAAVNATEVINEWQEGENIFVRAKVTLGALDNCYSPYRKRLVVTAFPFAQTGHVNAVESDDLSQGLARELLNRLVASGQFIGTDKSRIALRQTSNNAQDLVSYPYDQFSEIRQIADDAHAQFVLSGIIHDLAIEPNLRITGHDPISLAQNISRNLYRERSIAIEAFIHDGFSGALVGQYRYQDQVSGRIWLPEQLPVGSAAFQEHPVGAALANIIEHASREINQALRCQPFSARILKVERPTVFIDAGAQEGVRVGDQLLVYTQRSGILHFQGNQEYLGADQQPVTVMTITDVKPRYAFGKLDSEVLYLNLQPGDWVRSW